VALPSNSSPYPHPHEKPKVPQITNYDLIIKYDGYDGSSGEGIITLDGTKRKVSWITGDRDTGIEWTLDSVSLSPDNITHVGLISFLSGWTTPFDQIYALPLFDPESDTGYHARIRDGGISWLISDNCVRIGTIMPAAIEPVVSLSYRGRHNWEASIEFPKTWDDNRVIAWLGEHEAEHGEDRFESGKYGVWAELMNFDGLTLCLNGTDDVNYTAEVHKQLAAEPGKRLFYFTGSLGC